MIINRPSRLKGVPYVGFQRYFITTCTAFRHRAFENAGVAQSTTVQLCRTAQKFQFAVLAYCFMPDHVHLLVHGNSIASDLPTFVKTFKQLSGFEYRQQFHQRLWQPGYHDRVLRDSESTEAVIRYVLENPIRAGLTMQIGEYPHAGSEVYELKELMTAWDGHDRQT